MSLTKDLSSLSISPATLDQAKVHSKRTWIQWGRSLPFEIWGPAMEQFDNCESGKEGKLVTWVLAPVDNPTTVDFLCSCETYRRTIAVKVASSPTPERYTGYGVASVNTPPDHRRKGYARHMMRLLHYALADQSTSLHFHAFPSEYGSPPQIPPGFGNGLCSVLYSDVGIFYEGCDPGSAEAPKVGWRQKSAAGTIWTIADLPTFDSSDTVGLELTLLTGPQLDEVWKQDSNLMETELFSGSMAPPPSASFTFLPTEGTGAMQYQRWRAYIPTSLPPHLANRYDDLKWGAVLRPSTTSSPPSSLNYASWTLDVDRPGPRTLMITRFRFDSLESFKALLDAARRTALDWGLEQIEAWNLGGLQGFTDVDRAWRGEDITRGDHLPYVAWYGKESSEDVRWEWNEKFAWC